MRKIKFAYFIGIIAILLLILNFIIAYPDDFDKGFFLRAIANLMLIISMIISVRHIKKQDQNS